MRIFQNKLVKVKMNAGSIIVAFDCPTLVPVRECVPVIVLSPFLNVYHFDFLHEL
jgi:hypothetical protein